MSREVPAEPAAERVLEGCKGFHDDAIRHESVKRRVGEQPRVPDILEWILRLAGVAVHVGGDRSRMVERVAGGIVIDYLNTVPARACAESFIGNLDLGFENPLAILHARIEREDG